jgi:hypothetical protein
MGGDFLSRIPLLCFPDLCNIILMFQSSQLQYMFLNYDINEVDVSYLNVSYAYTYVIIVLCVP